MRSTTRNRDHLGIYRKSHRNTQSDVSQKQNTAGYEWCADYNTSRAREKDCVPLIATKALKVCRSTLGRPIGTLFVGSRLAQVVVVVAVVIEVGVDDVEASFSPKFGGKFAGGALQTHNTTRSAHPLLSSTLIVQTWKRRTTVRLTSSRPKHPHCSPRPSLQPTTPPSV